MLEVQNEYQLFVPTPKQLGRISEQSKFEEILPRIRENASQKQKLSKFELRQINSSRQILFRNEKNPYLDKPIEKSSSYQKTSQSQLSKSRSITDHQSPQKQQPIRSYKNNTENDQIIIHTDEEKGKTKYKRDEKKRKTSNFRAAQTDDPKIKQLDEQIQRLSDQLKNLKDYLNNSRKLFLVVRNLVGTRKNLRKVLIKNGKEELVDFSDLGKFYKFFYTKEIVNINGEQKLIDKLNFNLLDDLYYANEVLENLLVQNQILEIKRIADQNEINRLKTILRVNQVDDVQLSISSVAMSRYNLHEQVDMLEQRLGPLQSVQKQLKQTSQALTTIVKFLNDP